MKPKRGTRTTVTAELGFTWQTDRNEATSAAENARSKTHVCVQGHTSSPSNAKPYTA